jgi:DNA-binding XRE family transcriptional regulator
MAIEQGCSSVTIIKEIQIAGVIKMCGGKEQAAKKLNISLRWLYYLEKGEKVPGWHLYRDICEITEE